MLINTQHTSAIQKTQRTDLDSGERASALYSAAQQNAQPLTNLQATPASVAGNAQADNVNAAKTRVMLQASASSTGTTAKTSATDEFKDYMSKSPAQRIREQLLKEMGLTEDDFKAMPPEKEKRLPTRSPRSCNKKKRSNRLPPSSRLLRSRCNRAVA